MSMGSMSVDPIETFEEGLKEIQQELNCLNSRWIQFQCQLWVAIAVMTTIDFDVHFAIDLDLKICATFPQTQSHLWNDWLSGSGLNGKFAVT